MISTTTAAVVAGVRAVEETINEPHPWGEIPKEQWQLAAGLIDEILVSVTPETMGFIVEAVRRFQNVHQWVGEMLGRETQPIVGLASRGEWFEFIDDPSRCNMPHEHKLALGRGLLKVLIRANFGNAGFWEALVPIVPDLCERCRLLKVYGHLHAPPSSSAVA